jgi:CHASE3 domain sensor protein
MGNATTDEPPRWLGLRRSSTFLAVALLVAALAAAVINFVSWDRGREIVAAEAALVLESERLLSDVKDIETGERGYLIARDETYLEPYRAALRTLQARLDTIRQAASRVPRDTVDLDGLTRTVKAKTDLAAELIELRRRGGSGDELSPGVSRGRELMENLRTQVGAIEPAAAERLRRRNESERGQTILLTGPVAARRAARRRPLRSQRHRAAA